MIRVAFLTVVAIFALGVSSPTAATNAGFDARLTQYAYPYPTKTLRFESQGEALEMAYMDVAPAQPNGRAVLLLHGKNFSGAYWASTIDALTKAGYRVVVPDQIGFGKSTKSRSYQYSFQAFGDNTAQLLQQLEVETVTVVGHSMGGMVATRFALDHPEQTEKLVLVNPIGLEDWKRKVPYRSVDEWHRRELNKTREGVKKYMESSYFDGKWMPEYDPLVEIQAGWASGPDADLIAWVSALTYDMIFTQPVLYEFPDIQVPTLLIIGQRDRTALGKDAVTPEIANTLGRYPQLGRKAAKAIPGAELVELQNVGHVPQYESFDAYRDALLGFLAK
ncbi:MAG: alpha/beta hydrolase [Candidatus Eisenbacteria bacterium]|uniref:Alpha/beta hydrolase n=1 Tax=Eiseniibacteriota bacterium TaxID=2212470 RepID=A0A956NAK7_UNCEI|nr:alpha/beta hydrolase [Candidatus Eisenbacteria bacterium]MCB9466232.1 alpha/beta hydrolase [Candidatus Eisenbacteria bacterium]